MVPAWFGEMGRDGIRPDCCALRRHARGDWCFGVGPMVPVYALFATIVSTPNKLIGVLSLTPLDLGQRAVAAWSSRYLPKPSSTWSVVVRQCSMKLARM